MSTDTYSVHAIRFAFGIALLSGCASASSSGPLSDNFQPLDVVNLVIAVPHHLRLVWLEGRFEEGASARCPAVRPIRLILRFEQPTSRERIEVSSRVDCAWRDRRAVMPATVLIAESANGSLEATRGYLDPEEFPPARRSATAMDVRDVSPPTRPRRVSGDIPQVPAAMRAKGGLPPVRVCVRKDGSVSRMGLLIRDTRDPEVDAIVLDAVRRWKFEPARLTVFRFPAVTWRDSPMMSGEAGLPFAAEVDPGCPGRAPYGQGCRRLVAAAPLRRSSGRPDRGDGRRPRPLRAGGEQPGAIRQAAMALSSCRESHPHYDVRTGNDAPPPRAALPQMNAGLFIAPSVTRPRRTPLVGFPFGFSLGTCGGFW